MTKIWLKEALLPEGWAEGVTVDVEGGRIASVASGTEPGEAVRIEGPAVPGVPNLHSHAFQRGMAGLAERRGEGRDSFWTWREAMYHFLDRLTPDDVEAIAAWCQVEMLESGFTSLAEFHYLHTGVDGSFYDDPAEMAVRIAAAAGQTGIGLTLLPVFYAQGSFGGQAPGHGQRRFISDPAGFARLLEGARAALRDLPDGHLGIAPHSLRAVTPESLAEIVAMLPEGPIHIHVAEQTKEVDDCLAWCGERPVEWLLRRHDVDARWCLIHATHMDAGEVAGVAASGAVVGLCPITEANLGDGFFPATDYLEAGGRFGVGTDSNVRIDVAGELRTLEYVQRLLHEERNRLALAAGSVGRQLHGRALEGGTQALQRPARGLAAGEWADFVVLDPDHPALVGASGDLWLDGWLFAGGAACVRETWVRGEQVVREGRHVRRDELLARYARVRRGLLAG